MAIELTQRYEQISSKAYEHPADRAATSALRSVPLLDKVIKRLTDLGSVQVVMTPAEFHKVIVDETGKWAKVIKFSGIKPQ